MIGIGLFVILTLVAYIMIDFAVYWVGVGEQLTVTQIALHHLKMLPIYFGANVILSFGFLAGNEKMNTLLVFSISIVIWIVSLMVVSMVLYKTYPNIITVIGFAVIILGVILVNKGVGVV